MLHHISSHPGGEPQGLVGTAGIAGRVGGGEGSDGFVRVLTTCVQSLAGARRGGMLARSGEVGWLGCPLEVSFWGVLLVCPFVCPLGVSSGGVLSGCSFGVSFWGCPLGVSFWCVLLVCPSGVSFWGVLDVLSGCPFGVSVEF